MQGAADTAVQQQKTLQGRGWHLKGMAPRCLAQEVCGHPVNGARLHAQSAAVLLRFSQPSLAMP